MSHKFTDEVEEAAKPYLWDRAWNPHALRNDERHPKWFAHMRKCEKCARSYLCVPAEAAVYCAAGMRVKDRDLTATESDALGNKVRAKRLRKEARERRKKAS